MTPREIILIIISVVGILVVALLWGESEARHYHRKQKRKTKEN